MAIGTMTEKNIQDLLEKKYENSGAKYCVPNIYFFKFDWETDFLVVQKQSGYCYEIEIKVSRSDFFNDFKKVDKHGILREGFYQHPKYRYVLNESLGKRVRETYYEPRKWDFRPNRFYYCVPEGLIKPEETPDYAGLMYTDGKKVWIAKEAKVIHKEKLQIETKLCVKFYYYWKNARKEIALLEKRNLLNETKLEK